MQINHGSAGMQGSWPNTDRGPPSPLGLLRLCRCGAGPRIRSPRSAAGASRFKASRASRLLRPPRRAARRGGGRPRPAAPALQRRAVRPPARARGRTAFSPSRAVEIVEQADHLRRRGAAEAIIDRPGIAPRLDQCLAAQPRQMLRQMRLSHVEQPLQLADGFLALGQVAQDDQPVLVREPLEQDDRPCGARPHLRYVHDRRITPPKLATSRVRITAATHESKPLSRDFSRPCGATCRGRGVRLRHLSCARRRRILIIGI